MIETWTEDDFDLFEEVTGLSLVRDLSGNRLELLQDVDILPKCGIFHYEWSTEYVNMMAWEVIESVILLAHSIPRKDLEEMLR